MVGNDRKLGLGSVGNGGQWLRMVGKARQLLRCLGKVGNSGQWL